MLFLGVGGFVGGLYDYAKRVRNSLFKRLSAVFIHFRFVLFAVS